jgi:hypothetical protein
MVEIISYLGSMSAQIAKGRKKANPSTRTHPARGQGKPIFGVTSSGRVYERYQWATETDTDDDDDDDDGESSPSKHQHNTMTPSMKLQDVPETDKEEMEEASDTEDDDEHQASISVMTDSDKGKGICQLNYEKSGNSKAVLLATLLGLYTEEGRSIANLDEKPYKSCSNRKKVIPSNPLIKEEIIRRVKENQAEAGKEPKCTNWTRPKCRDW